MPTITIPWSDEEALNRLIPEHCREGLKLYFEEGIMPGGFLTAVLENDLVGAFSKADQINSGRMEDYARYLWNYADRRSYGSPQKVIMWCETGGLRGQAERKAKREAAAT